MKIFAIKNDKVELRDQYIDLHGLSKVEALNIVRMRLSEVRENLSMGHIAASTGDNINHVVKIVCGRGSHSNGRAVLKFAIPSYLVRVFCLNLFNRETMAMISTTTKTMEWSLLELRRISDTLCLYFDY